MQFWKPIDGNHTYVCMSLCWLIITPMQATSSVPETADLTNRSCISLRINKETIIAQPGHYCLDRDYKFTCAPNWMIWEGGTCSPVRIRIRSADVNIDFKGRRIVAVNHGIVISGSKQAISLSNAKLIADSVQILLDGEGVQGYEALPHESLRDRKELVGRAPPDPKDCKAKSVRYVDLDTRPTKTRFRVENMLIESQDANVILTSGDGNSLLNNSIKARTSSRKGPAHICDQEVAILNYGAEATIQGNRIQYAKSMSYDSPTFAIYLRNAAGSLVSENSVQFRGHRRATIGVGLQDSPDTQIRSNSIKGAEQKVAEVSD